MSTNDVFQNILSIIDDNKEKLKDIDYKSIVELISESRKSTLKLYWMRVVAPEIGFAFGEIGWKTMTFHIPLDEEMADVLRHIRMIPVRKLLGNSIYTICEHQLISLHCSSLPVIDFKECECGSMRSCQEIDESSE